MFKLKTVIFIVFILFASQHISSASGYKNVSGKKISWDLVEITSTKGWIGKKDRKMYKLLYKYSNNEYAAILVGKAVKIDYKQYKKVLVSTYSDFKKDPTNKHIKFITSSKYTVLGKKHAPCITFVTKGKRFFMFMPYINSKMYMLLAISWRKNSLTLPPYTVKMIDNIYIKGTRKKHKNPQKSAPILVARHKYKTRIKPMQTINYLDKFTNTSSITTTKSLMHKLYGQLSQNQQKILNKQFDKYYEYPCDSVKKYFFGLNKVLYKAVKLKTELSVDMAEYAKYSADAYNAYKYKNKQMAEESLRMLLEKRKQILDIHKKLNLVNSELAKYMKMPNPEKLKKTREKRLEKLLKTVEKTKKYTVEKTNYSIKGMWEIDPNEPVIVTRIYAKSNKVSIKKIPAKNLDNNNSTGFMEPLSAKRIYLQDAGVIYKNFHLIFLYRYNDRNTDEIVAKKVGSAKYVIFDNIMKRYGSNYKFTMSVNKNVMTCIQYNPYGTDEMFIYKYTLRRNPSVTKYPKDVNYSFKELQEDAADMIRKYRKLPLNKKIVKPSMLNDDAPMLQHHIAMFMFNSTQYDSSTRNFSSIPSSGDIDIKSTHWKLKKVKIDKQYIYPYEINYSISKGWIAIYKNENVPHKQVKMKNGQEYVPSINDEEPPEFKKVLVAKLYWNPPRKIYKEGEVWNVNLKGKSSISLSWRVVIPSTFTMSWDDYKLKRTKEYVLPPDKIKMTNDILNKRDGLIALEFSIKEKSKGSNMYPKMDIIYQFFMENKKIDSQDEQEYANLDIEGLTDKEDFYKTQIEWLKKDIAAYKRMLRRVKTDSQRQQLKLIIMGKEADLQQQKDLLNELKTGKFRHTPTNWDRYNANLTKEVFIKESVSYQKRMGAFDSINRLSAIMKKHGYTESADWALRNAREALKKSDNSQLEKIYRVLRKKYTNTLEKEQAGSALKLLEAEDRLERVKKVKYWSEFGVMAGSMGYAKAGAYVYAGYTGITNGLSDGIASGIKHAVENLNSVTMVAASAYDGYNITDPTTGKKMGIKGAALNAGFTLAAIGAIHMATSRVISRCSVAENTYKKYSVDIIDSAKYQQEREMSLVMVQNYEKNIRHMEEELKKGNTEIVRQYAKKMESETEKLMASPQAKNYLKYKAPKSLQRVYIHYENKVKKRVIADFKNRMKKLGWQDFEVREFRNAASGDSVGMDWDLGLVEDNLKTEIVNGKPVKFIKKGGRYVTLDEFQKEAEREFNKAYKDRTGQLAKTSFANLTTSVHEESFVDVEILKNAADAKPELAKETAKTIKHKALAMGSINTGLVTKTGKYNEMCRGLAKEINTKLIPNLEQNKKLSKDGIKAGVKYFEAVSEVLQQFGRNDISIVDAEIRIRNLTGKSIPEMAELISSKVESAIKGKVK